MRPMMLEVLLSTCQACLLLRAVHSIRVFTQISFAY